MPTGAMPVACVIRVMDARLGSPPLGQALMLPCEDLLPSYYVEFFAFDATLSALAPTAATLVLHDGISNARVNITLNIQANNSLRWNVNPAQIPGQVGEGQIKQCTAFFLVTAGGRQYCSEEIMVYVYGYQV